MMSPVCNNTCDVSMPGSSREPEQTTSGLPPESLPRSPTLGSPASLCPCSSSQTATRSRAGIECHVLESLLLVGGFAGVLLVLTHLCPTWEGRRAWLSVTQREQRVESAFHVNEEQGR